MSEFGEPWKNPICTIGDPDNVLNLMIRDSFGRNIARLFSDRSTIRGLSSLAPTQADAQQISNRIITCINFLEGVSNHVLVELMKHPKVLANQKSSFDFIAAAGRAGLLDRLERE
jgi:hypothetical protein